ncbi:MAG: TraB family protein, partial [Methanosarcinales archaeon]
LSGIMEIETFKEMMQNKAFRVILVAALANIGSMIGTFIGAWVVFQLFGFDPAEWLKNALFV